MIKFFLPLLLIASTAFGGVDLSNKFKLGDGQHSNKVIEADRGAVSFNPKLRWNDGGAQWEFSNDGVSFVGIGTGGGGGGCTTGPRSEIWVYNSSGGGQGSTNTKIRYYNTVGRSLGTDITRTASTSLGDAFTINVTGVYAISVNDEYSAAAAVIGISLNSSQLSTDITSITAANVVGISNAQGAGAPGGLSVTLNLTAGDVIRVHGGVLDATNNFASMRITRVAF